ncbi:pyrroline-5-carboxylate reductase [Leucobacter chromiireducens]|uniref:pyrroline-5-carboxylate reductase n=1 Tax=Leucobacter chromiireducens TaxID=283877 RepID=UPI000F62E2F6|nr:pyrroline-5-carboxylate reductase [Leucobacter chromiireducens]
MIGVGSMGGAILAGLRGPEVAIARPIRVTTNSAASAAQFAGADDVVARAVAEDPEANRAAVAGAGLVILAVKPWLILDTAREIADALEPGAIVVSVAAGVPSAAIEAVLPAGTSVVRTMPNTPSHIGRGVTGIAGGANASDADVALVRALFETVGSVLVVREDQINDVGAVSGSGPAYVFLFVEEMIAAAERRGFTPEQARELVQQTLVGSALLLEASGEDPAQLRRNVTSPKGTTEQSVLVLQEGGWPELFDRALAANVRRAKELEAQ